MSLKGCISTQKVFDNGENSFKSLYGTVAGKLEVPVSNWSAGTYIVKINSNDAETTLKVVKQ